MVVDLFVVVKVKATTMNLIHTLKCGSVLLLNGEIEGKSGID